MTDQELRSTLISRIDHLETTLQAACARVGRTRAEVQLVAVSKTVSARVIRIMREMGITDFGESRPQVLWSKAEEIADVNWHLIGHLQRNKIERTAPLLHLMHTLDSTRLATSLNEEQLRKSRPPLSVIIEVNLTRESNKGGFSPEEVPPLGEFLASLPGIRIAGFMTMAAYSDNPESSRSTFAELRQLRDAMQQSWGNRFDLSQLSMGMSNDYAVAVEEGATLIRPGTTLFNGLESE